MAAILLLSCVMTSILAATDPDPSFLLMQLTNLELSLATVQSQLDQTTHEQRSTADELVSIKAELRLAQDYIETLENTIKEVRTQCNDTLSENKDILEEVNVLKTRVGEGSSNETLHQLSGLKGDYDNTMTEVNALKDSIGRHHDDYVSLHAEVEMLKTDTRLTGQDLAVVRYEAEQNKADLNKINAEVSQIKNNDVKAGTSIDNTLLHSFNASLKATNTEVSVLSNKLATTKFDVSSTVAVVNSLQTKVNDLETDMTSQLGNIQGQLMTSSNLDLRGQVNATSVSVSDINTRLSAVETSVLHDNDVITSVKSQLQTLQQNISSCQGTERDIGYEVRLHMDMMTVQMGEKLMFEKTLYNHGNGYDDKHGIFTAPVTGSYFFWAQLTMAQANSMLTLHLLVNGRDMAKSFIETPDDRVYGMLSLTTATHLNKGDIVWFQKAEGTVNIYGKMYSGYGGVLVSS